jgi:hypothetical protein
MNTDLKYPNWQEPLAAAILEFNPRKLPAKIQRAEAAIASRFHELAFERDSLEESRLLSDGSSILQELKKIVDFSTQVPSNREMPELVGFGRWAGVLFDGFRR